MVLIPTHLTLKNILEGELQVSGVKEELWVGQRVR